MTGLPMPLWRGEPLDQWLIAFVDYGQRHWWCRLLRPGFRHVFALGYDDGGWLVLNVGLDAMIARRVGRDEVDWIMTDVKLYGRWLQVAVPPARPRNLPRFGLTCVTAVEHLLGLPGCALTPFRLYRRLLRRGAIPWPADAGRSA